MQFTDTIRYLKMLQAPESGFSQSGDTAHAIHLETGASLLIPYGGGAVPYTLGRYPQWQSMIILVMSEGMKPLVPHRSLADR